MDLPNHNFDELLSGMLDGMLSDQELRLLEQSLSDDPTLGSKLEELAASRSALLRGRSRGRLGSDFARTVTSNARERAVAMGLDAPDWLVSSDFKRPSTSMKPAVVEAVSPLESIPVFKRAWVYSCVGLAAVFALVFVIVREPQTQGLVQLDPKPYVTSEESELKVIEKAEALLAARPSVTENANEIVSPNSDSNKDLSSAIASIETETDASATPETMSSVETVSSLSAKNVESNQIASAEVPPIIKEDLKNTVVVANPKKSKASRTLAIYITVDEVALKNRALESILEENGVVYSSDHVLSDEELNRLAQSGFVSTNKVDEGDMQVLFLKSTVENIGLAMQSMLDQEKDFPQCKLGMTTDASVAKLVKQLSRIQVAESSKGFARRILPPSGNAANTPFVVAKWENGRSPSNVFGKPISAEMAAERQQMANALLFVRPAK